MKAKRAAAAAFLCAAVVAVIWIVQAGCCPAAKPSADAFNLPTADVVVRAKIAELDASKFVKEFSEKIKALPMVQAAMQGKDTSDLTKSSLGVEAKDIAALNMSLHTESEKVLGCVVCKVDIDADKVIGTLAEEGQLEVNKAGEHAGVTLYSMKMAGMGMMPMPAEMPEMIVAFPDKRLMAVGTADEVKKGIENYKACKTVGHSAEVSGLLAKAPKDASVTVAVAVKADPAAGANDVKGALITAKAGADLKLSASIQAKDKAAADKMREQVSGGVAGIKAQMSPEGAPPEAVQQMKPIVDLLDGVVVGGAGDVVELGVTVKSDVVEALPVIMGMMMMQAMGGGAQGGMGAPSADPGAMPDF